MSHKHFLFLFLIFSSLTLGCVKAQPVFFDRGKEHCAHCSMAIIDMRFHTQAVTTKGKRFYFDSIECYHEYQKVNHLNVKHAWIANYLQPSEMLEESKAYILKSTKIRSPMGAGLAAFKSEDDSKLFLNDSATK